MLPAHPKSGYCDIQGRRRGIEDFHAIHLQPSHQFYGVFDGHTGNLASKFAASSFYEHLSQCLSNVDEEALADSNWKSHVVRNLTESFAQVHDSFLMAVALAPHGVMDQSGTTATTVFVTNSTVVVASIGDSRAVLSVKDAANQMGAIQLTVDHIAANEVERLLVEARGGQVVVTGGMARANGTLAITRSIGDADLAPILSRTPHVVAFLKSEIHELCGIADFDPVPCFIVLATDGLWDVVTNEEAVNLVSQVVVSYDTEDNGLSWEEGGAFQKAAERLTQEAYVRGSTDNIGVCIIALD
jgi:protein phosphatase 1L